MTEDDQVTAALIAGELVDRGFAVGVAHDGREGLAAILRQTPDLVLCDMSMPFMSGFTVIERLTKIVPGFGYMPFVFLTARPTARRNSRRGGSAPTTMSQNWSISMSSSPSSMRAVRVPSMSVPRAILRA